MDDLVNPESFGEKFGLDAPRVVILTEFSVMGVSAYQPILFFVRQRFPDTDLRRSKSWPIVLLVTNP